MIRRSTEADLEEILGWFHSRKIEITRDYLSLTGFIEPGVAAGYIYGTDANFCIFECFISNPNTTKSERQQALRQIVVEMIKEAKEMGYKQAYGFATSKTMVEIGYENEFKFVETCSTIVRNL
jgi:L-amino acid N-acyltransferase YncA